MKHITYDEGGGWNLRPYFAYLETVRTQMSEALYAFAAKVEHYDLSSPTSLHDAWLEQLVIRDPIGGKLEIAATYLAPFHDRQIHLTYRSVLGYSFVAPQGMFGMPPMQSGHGDLLMHEVRMSGGAASFEHELVFSKGAILVVQFEDFEHRIEVIGHRT